MGVGAEGGGAGGAAPGDEAQGPGPGAREPAETFRPGSAGGGRRRVATLARGCWGRGMWGWDFGVNIPIEPEKRLAARTLRLLLHSGMGGNPPASALVGGGGDGPEGWGPGGRRGRSGQPGAPEALVVNTLLPGTHQGLRRDRERRRGALWSFVEISASERGCTGRAFREGGGGMPGARESERRVATAIA